MRLALVGESVSKSLSPPIHRAMFELANIDGTYEAISCTSEDLRGVITDLRDGVLDGVNVTMPFKQVAATLCDVVEGPARISGSVNTLRMAGDALVGSSTDSKVFQDLLLSFNNCSAVHILGTGGSALAALSAIEGHTVYLSGRNPKAIEALVARFDAVAVPWGTGVADALVVNATPIGSRGEELPHHVLAVAGALVDLPYGPTPTPAVIESERRATPVVGGKEFLIRQAVYSFNLWTGADLELTAVVAAV